MDCHADFQSARNDGEGEWIAASLMRLAVTDKRRFYKKWILGVKLV